MPRYVLVPRLSESEARLVRVLGINQVKLSIVKALAAQDEVMTTSSLIEELGGEVQLVTMLRHLRALEEEGVVSSSAPSGSRQGRTVEWQLERGRLRDDLQALLDLLA